jgi:hypothetical protein
MQTQRRIYRSQQRHARALRKVARLGEQRGKLLERLLVLVGEAVQLGAVDVDDGDGLVSSLAHTYTYMHRHSLEKAYRQALGSQGKRSPFRP